MGWKPPGNDDNGPAPPKSFDNPVFREHHQQQEEVEADEFRPDELPPGMTMEDPRNPNSNKRRKSKRGENRYHDEDQHNQTHQDQGPARPNKGNKYKEFEIPEGMPQCDLFRGRQLQARGKQDVLSWSVGGRARDTCDPGRVRTMPPVG